MVSEQRLERLSSLVSSPCRRANNSEDTRAIEVSTFPFEELCDVAELESWRKEVNRPIYHIHKWWAQRLGSVFRAILIATFSPRDADVLKLFYQPLRLSGPIVFDPFMGSGTTVGEALKLGARAIGRDINPVACFAVRNALSMHSRQQVIETFEQIERDIAPTIKRFYQSRLPNGNGNSADVLYYFWVKVVPCPACHCSVDLFSSYVFAQNAYAARKPEARAVCPKCGGISVTRYDAESLDCIICNHRFNPQIGPAGRTATTCPNCLHTFPLVNAVRDLGEPPSHRLYAKMVLSGDESKEYMPADGYDLELYQTASLALKKRQNAYPVVEIEPGYNTNQVLNYCYTHWHQMFNDRQLYCLSLLAERIRAIPSESLRELFTCLFSGTLEFNNMFASFKGEGTGAVRHMFAHHILKPERTPLEANLWGTPKSSGAFSTLFRSRLLRAIDYRERPFEIRVSFHKGIPTSDKVYGLSPTLGYRIAETFADFTTDRSLYLSCGDSSKTDLPDESVDAVITDPPFFDNVHYSQLADFFYVWQRFILGPNGHHQADGTRSLGEVQHSEAAQFTERLSKVWTECHRVLRYNGLLVFTYHHSRVEGWLSILESLVRAGFVVMASHPIKAEMSIAMPKQQAKEPIDLDIILVCRKRESIRPDAVHLDTLIAGDATKEAMEQIARLNGTGRHLSRNDVRVVLTAHIIKRLSWQPSLVGSLHYLTSNGPAIEDAIANLHRCQQVAKLPAKPQKSQLAMW